MSMKNSNASKPTPPTRALVENVVVAKRRIFLFHSSACSIRYSENVFSCLVGVIVPHRCLLDASLKDTRYAIDMRWMSADTRQSVPLSRQWQRVLLQPYELTCLLDWESRRLMLPVQFATTFVGAAWK
jgi:hypothetical protein